MRLAVVRCQRTHKPGANVLAHRPSARALPAFPRLSPVPNSFHRSFASSSKKKNSKHNVSDDDSSPHINPRQAKRLSSGFFSATQAPATLTAPAKKKSFEQEYAEVKSQHEAKLKELAAIPQDKKDTPISPRKAPFAGVTVEDLKKIDPAERLKDPNLKFEGEDEIPSEYQVLMRGISTCWPTQYSTRLTILPIELDGDYNRMKMQVRELFKNPEFVLYERVLNTRIRAMNMAYVLIGQIERTGPHSSHRWLIDPTPPRPTDHAALESKRKQIIDETKEEFAAFYRLREQMTKQEEKKQFVKWLKEIEHLKIQIKESQSKSAKEVKAEELVELQKIAMEMGAKMQADEAEEKRETEGKLYKDYDKINIYREEVIAQGETPFSPVDRIEAHLHRRERQQKMASEEKLQEYIQQGVKEGWEDILGRKPTNDEEELLDEARSMLGGGRSQPISPFAQLIPRTEEEEALEAARLAEGIDEEAQTPSSEIKTGILRHALDERYKAAIEARKTRERKKEKRLEKILRQHGVDVDALNSGKVPWPNSAEELEKLMENTKPKPKRKTRVKLKPKKSKQLAKVG